MSTVESMLSATLDLGEVEKGLDAMERRAKALGPAFRELRSPMRADQRDHGKKQAGPFGRWARRAASTLAVYRKKGRTPRPLGKLLSAVRVTSDATGVYEESRVKWSNAHMEGARVGRGVKLKARPFFWVSRKLLDEAEEKIGSAVVASFEGR